MQNKAVFAKMFWGLVAGVLIATSVSWFAGMVYREGSLLAPFVALMLATVTPFALEAPLLAVREQFHARGIATFATHERAARALRLVTDYWRFHTSESR